MYMVEKKRSNMSSDIFLRIILSVILGGLIGLEREIKKKPAGLITLTLVCLGATMIAILQEKIILTGDATRLSAQVISGVGFIGGGTIIHTKGDIQGITTAAIIWVNACLGLIIGYGLIKLGFLCFSMIITILIFMRIFEEKVVHNKTKVKVLIKIENKDEILNIKSKFYDKNTPIKLCKIKWQNFETNLVECIFLIDNRITPLTLEKELLTNKKIKEIIFY